ncbi:MAG: flagellar export protein FliJ [Sulfurimonadaceae bacterium]|nr:flagellar export protein FliJ [Sulfurimonadaceae bacterium]
MKTKYTTLVSLKKNALDKSETKLQRANLDFANASKTLENAYKALDDVGIPESGSIMSLLASRMLLQTQRGVIEHNKEWVTFTKQQLQVVQKELQKDMVEYEKYKYLENYEIQKIVNELKIEEAKELDEIASITFYRKNIQE